MKVGELVKLRANKNLYGFVQHIISDKFCYIIWFNNKNSLHPYAFTSLEKVS